MSKLPTLTSMLSLGPVAGMAAASSLGDLSEGDPAEALGYQPLRGPHGVTGTADLILRDESRRKNLHVRVSMPMHSTPSPVIAFSHGYGGSKDGYRELCRYWASHGYVVIQPNHDDADALKGGLAALAERPRMRDQMMHDLAQPENWQNRVLDLATCLDSLDEIEERVPSAGSAIDPTRIGAGGHSFGAFTTHLIGGATIRLPGASTETSYADPRPAALLGMSAQGSGWMGLAADSWRSFTRPMMLMTGTLDRGFAGHPPQWRLEPFHLAPPGDKYAIFIKGAGHMWFTGMFTRLGRMRAAAFDYVKVASLAFWDAYLGGSVPAKQWLASGALQDASNGIASIALR
jgi:dienelactone hydrolase